jgi:hypothetical protein
MTFCCSCSKTAAKTPPKVVRARDIGAVGVAADLGGAMAAITNAAASGAITPARRRSWRGWSRSLSVETGDFERRLKELEEAHAAHK